MAIAEAEPKKSDADETKTGGSKDFGSGSKSPTDKENPGTGSTKMYGLYYNIKDFAFSMPDGWDDENISIFIECCKEEIEEFRHPGEDINWVWHKIAKLGAEKSGKVTCFTVNSCLELSECLKAYVMRNEKRIDNEAFKKLYDDVIDLLQYFPGNAESANKNVRHRSRSKSTEKKCDIYGKAVSSVESESAVSLKEPVQLPSAHQTDNLIIMYYKQYKSAFPKSTQPYILRKISANLSEKHGIKIDVKKRLDVMKKNVAREVKKEVDPKNKMKIFMSLTQDFLEYFDAMPPRTIKRKDLLGLEEGDVILKNEERGVKGPTSESDENTNEGSITDNADTSKVTSETEGSSSAEGNALESHLPETSRPYKKRGKQKEATTPEVEPTVENLIPADHNIVAPTIAVTKKEVLNSNSVTSLSSDTTGGNSGTSNQLDNAESLPSEKSSLPDEIVSATENSKCLAPKSEENSQESELQAVSVHVSGGKLLNNEENTENESRNDSELSLVPEDSSNQTHAISKLNEPITENIQDTATVHEPSSVAHEEPLDSEQVSSSEATAENEEALCGENKYSLRRGKDMIKYFNNKSKKNTKKENVKNKSLSKIKENPPSSKRVLPQRSARAKTTSYRVSEEETSPDTFFQEESSPIASPQRNSSPDLKGFPTSQTLSSIYKLKRAYAQSLQQTTFENLEKEADSVKRRKYTYKEDNGKRNNVSHQDLVERVHGLRPKQGSKEDSISSQSNADNANKCKNAIVMLRDIKEIGSSISSRDSCRVTKLPNPPRRGRPPLSQKRNQARTVSSTSNVSNENLSEEIKLLRRKGNDYMVEPKTVNAVYSPNRSNLRDYQRISPTKPSTSYNNMRSVNVHGGNPRMNHPTSLKSNSQVRENVTLLDDLDASTAAIIERYKNRVGESAQSKAIMQLLPSSQSTNSSRQSSGPVVLSSNSQQSIPANSGMEVVSTPPEWFGNFVTDYRKHEMWKMHQLLKMQQELVDMENRKLAVLENILVTLKKDGS